MSLTNAGSLQTRLTRLLLGSCGALLLVIFWGLDAWVTSRLRNQFDRGLETRARALVTLTKRFDHSIELDFADEFMPEFDRKLLPDFFQLWHGSERVVERSNSLGRSDLPRLPNDRPGVARFRDLTLPDGRQGRLVQLNFRPQAEGDSDRDEGDSDRDEANADLRAEERSPGPSGPGGDHALATIIVATGRQDLDATLSFLRLSLGGSGLLLMLAIAMVVRLAVRSGMRPFHEVGEQIELLDGDRLDGRVAVPRIPSELAPLIGRLNALLDRLERSVARERRFSSDLAHELRTPVAELVALAEVGGRWPDDRHAVEAFFDDVAEIARQMERTIGNLLALARCDAGIEDLHLQEVDLGSLVKTVWSRIQTVAAERDVTMGATVSNEILYSDVVKLELLVSNLLVNAVTYAPRGTVVHCRGIVDSDTFRLELANQAPLLSEVDLSVMFDRFWRKDAARSGGQHAGLGLSLVGAVATVLGYTVTAGLSHETEQILTMTLSGPRVLSPPPRDHCSASLSPR